MDAKVLNDDTPRSITSPRDDRFFTPRTIARSTSASNSDEWQTPRFENDFQTPRSLGSYQTPRSHYEADRKDGRTNSYGSKDSGDASYSAQAKQFYGSSQQDSAQQTQQPFGSPRYTAYPRFAQNKRSFIAEEDEEQELDDVVPTTIDENDIEDIFSFARHGRIEEIERLLDKGVPVDVRDQFGNTILITACQNGNKRVAKAVLRRGSDINSRNFKGNTPLHYCYQYGYGDSLGQYLIEKGANAEARNHAGKLAWEGI